MQKIDLPEVRNNDTKTIEVHVDENNGKNGGYMPSSLGNSLISMGRQLIQKNLRFDNFNLGLLKLS